MKNHNSSRRSSLPLGVFALATMAVCGARAVQAQPDLENGPKANNPTNHPAAGVVDPVERAQQRFRRQLQIMGLNQVVLQDAIIAYVDAETTARANIATKGRELQTGLQGNALTDVQTTALLNDYQATVEEDKARHTKALVNLTQSVDVTKYPKVQALLTLMGMYGDGPAVVSAYGQTGRGGGMGALQRGGAFAALGGGGLLGAFGAQGGFGAARGGANAPAVGGFGAVPAGRDLGGFGQAAPATTAPKPTQPNIKAPVKTDPNLPPL